MRQFVFENAQREFLRYLRLGKSLHSPGGLSEIRKFVAAIQIDPEIRELCGKYHVSVRDLCTLCMEIFTRMPDPLLTDDDGNLFMLKAFGDAVRFENLLKQIHHAAFGLTPHHRRLALVRCGEKQAKEIIKALPKAKSATTRSDVLQSSIAGKMPALFACAATLILVLILLIYLL